MQLWYSFKHGLHLFRLRADSPSDLCGNICKQTHATSLGSSPSSPLESTYSAWISLISPSSFSNCFDMRPYHITHIADSAQTEYCPTFHCPFVTGMTSHNCHIYKGINTMLIIRGPIKPWIFWIKITLAIFLPKTRPDKTIFSALTNLTIDFDFELSKIIKI